MIIYKCLFCNECCSKKFNEKFKFKGTFKFSNGDINKFINLLLRKGIYTYEYMDDWESSNETKLPEKEEFHSNLNLEDITDADYMHVKRVCKDFEIKNLSEDHGLYIKWKLLLLGDVFKNFREMCLKFSE